MRTYGNLRNICSLGFALFVTACNFLVCPLVPEFSKTLVNWSRLYFIFDMYKIERIFILHHCVALTILTITTNSYMDNLEELTMLRIWLNTEISTIFLNLYFVTKYKIFGLIFVPTFLYYRIWKFLQYLSSSTDLIVDGAILCFHNKLITNYNTCYGITRITNYMLLGLNTFWLYKIINTIQNKTYLKRTKVYNTT